MSVLRENHWEQLLHVARPLRVEEKNQWVTIWKNLVRSDRLLRTQNGIGEISSVDENFYDKALLANCRPEFVRAARLVGETLVDTNFEICDYFLNWRLRMLVEKELLLKRSATGSFSMGEYDVCLASAHRS